jgi:hypothetical protein
VIDRRAVIEALRCEIARRGGVPEEPQLRPLPLPRRTAEEQQAMITACAALMRATGDKLAD